MADWHKSKGSGQDIAGARRDLLNARDRVRECQYCYQGWAYVCPKCHRLIVFETERGVCEKCGEESRSAQRCPHCWPAFESAWEAMRNADSDFFVGEALDLKTRRRGDTNAQTEM